MIIASIGLSQQSYNAFPLSLMHLSETPLGEVSRKKHASEPSEQEIIDIGMLWLKRFSKKIVPFKEEIIEIATLTPLAVTLSFLHYEKNHDEQRRISLRIFSISKEEDFKFMELAEDGFKALTKSTENTKRAALTWLDFSSEILYFIQLSKAKGLSEKEYLYDYLTPAERLLLSEAKA